MSLVTFHKSFQNDCFIFIFYFQDMESKFITENGSCMFLSSVYNLKSLGIHVFHVFVLGVCMSVCSVSVYTVLVSCLFVLSQSVLSGIFRQVMSLCSVSVCTVWYL